MARGGGGQALNQPQHHANKQGPSPCTRRGLKEISIAKGPRARRWVRGGVTEQRLSWQALRVVWGDQGGQGECWGPGDAPRDAEGLRPKCFRQGEVKQIDEGPP